jgi:hypothetical protein
MLLHRFFGSAIGDALSLILILSEMIPALQVYKKHKKTPTACASGGLMALRCYEPKTIPLAQKLLVRSCSA